MEENGAGHLGGNGDGGKGFGGGVVDDDEGEVDGGVGRTCGEIKEAQVAEDALDVSAAVEARADGGNAERAQGWGG